MQGGGQAGLVSRMDSIVTPLPAPAEERAAGPIFSRHLWEDWIGSPTSKELWVQTLAYNGLLLLNALIGTIWLIRMWRSSAPAEAEAATA
jgi:hypothetical protein